VRSTGGWREWGEGVHMHVVPVTPPWSAHCCDHAGSSNPANPTGMNSPTCTPGGCPPVSSQSPGTGSPAMMPSSVRSACTCLSRGSLDNVYPFRPPGALFGPFFPPPFPMHPHLAAAAAAGFPFTPPGVTAPEQLLGSGPVQVQDRTENGVAAAAALQYQNETINQMFAHYMESWKSWYLQAASMANPPCFETPPPAPRPSTPQSPS